MEGNSHAVIDCDRLRKTPEGIVFHFQKNLVSRKCPCYSPYNKKTITFLKELSLDVSVKVIFGSVPDGRCMHEY